MRVYLQTRREQRKACMDLQTFTINFPKGRMKQINKQPIGHYPVALVPGQFTDYYKVRLFCAQNLPTVTQIVFQVFTPTEINNLPLNTMCYDPINIRHDDDSQSDGSGSDSDSSSSDSDSSDSVSSENCTVCSSKAKQISVRWQDAFTTFFIQIFCTYLFRRWCNKAFIAELKFCSQKWFTGWWHEGKFFIDSVTFFWYSYFFSLSTAITCTLTQIKM